jgi:hypothetical protein
MCLLGGRLFAAGVNAALYKKVLTQFGPELAPGWHFVDSTHVKVRADGSNPVGGQAAQAMGRTKGGLNTKIHALVKVREQALVIASSGGNGWARGRKRKQKVVPFAYSGML